MYLLNSSKNEVWRLRQELRDKDRLIEELRQQLYAASFSTQPSTTSPQKIYQPQLPSPVDEKTFVSVIFKENDRKFYDYFVGKNQDINVGDFVEVYFTNKDSGKVERRAAQVVYISKPGEVSDFARSVIKCKSDRNKW